MFRTALTIVVAIYSTASHALNCLPPDAVRLYQIAAGAKEQFLVVHGAFDITEMDVLRDKYPGGYDETAAAIQDIIGLKFTGKILTRNSFSGNFERQITLRLSCLGPWCTSVPGAEPMLAFLQATGDGYLLDINACGGMGLQGVDQAALDRVIACHSGVECIEAPLR